VALLALGRTTEPATGEKLAFGLTTSSEAWNSCVLRIAKLTATLRSKELEHHEYTMQVARETFIDDGSLEEHSNHESSMKRIDFVWLPHNNGNRMRRVPQFTRKQRAM
jgi:hypothetical protein